MRLLQLDYCLECEKILHFYHKRITLWFYVCSQSCLEKWWERPEEERDSIISGKRSDNKTAKPVNANAVL